MKFAIKSKSKLTPEDALNFLHTKLLFLAFRCEIFYYRFTGNLLCIPFLSYNITRCISSIKSIVYKIIKSKKDHILWSHFLLPPQHCLQKMIFCNRQPPDILVFHFIYYLHYNKNIKNVNCIITLFIL